MVKSSNWQDAFDMQFEDSRSAEELIRVNLAKTFPKIAGGIKEIKLQTRADSLASVKAWVVVGNQKLFLKTHVEHGGLGISNAKYYDFDLLEDWAVIKPKYMVAKKKNAIALYDMSDVETLLFDYMRDIELGRRDASKNLLKSFDLTNKDLLDRYASTLTTLSAKENQQKPIHELFYYRIKRNDSRLANWYSGKNIIQNNKKYDLEDIFTYEWCIDSECFESSIVDLIADSRILLSPQQESTAVVQHGDAHPGNICIPSDVGNRAQVLPVFDAAYACCASPWFGISKRLFHSVFSEWMYFADEVNQNIQLEVQIDERAKKINVDTDFIQSKIRKTYLDSFLDKFLKPFVAELKKQDMLDKYWEQKLGCALMCNALLTNNLLKYPEKISFLAMAYAVMLGNFKKDYIKQWTK